MKKAYIKPQNDVVIVEACHMIADSLKLGNASPFSQNAGNGTGGEISEDNLSRETIKSQDAWEEW